MDVGPKIGSEGPSTALGAESRNKAAARRGRGRHNWLLVLFCGILSWMSEPIDAIYDNGVLKPLVPLVLPDKVRVKLTIDASRGTGSTSSSVLEPQDEWERRLLGIAKDCGVSLSDAAVSSDRLYE